MPNDATQRCLFGFPLEFLLYCFAVLLLAVGRGLDMRKDRTCLKHAKSARTCCFLPFLLNSCTARSMLLGMHAGKVEAFFLQNIYVEACHQAAFVNRCMT